MARTQAADYESQRMAILEHAAEAFAASGYAACTMADVAAKSGASKARLYHYYASKEAILFDLLDRHTEHLQAIARETRERALREGLAPRAELELMIRDFLEAYRTARTRHIALLNDVKFLGEAQRARIVARERAVVEAFAVALERAFPGRVTAANRRAVTMMLMGAMNWTFTWLKPDGALTYAEYAATVADVLFRGLEGAPTAQSERRMRVAAG
ncbi:MAG: TetR family transcriptional regulator [Burkholderiales bacterium]|nr:TetR family transcriptional regulator [Burkholderiales bacterium]